MHDESEYTRARREVSRLPPLSGGGYTSLQESARRFDGREKRRAKKRQNGDESAREREGGWDVLVMLRRDSREGC